MALIEALTRFTKQIPGWVWLAVGSLLVAAFWMHQHDARIRQQVRLQQLQNETSAQVAELRKQAAQDVKQANVENAKAIAKLEQRRQQAEQQSRQLAAQLARLREQAQIQAGEVATLPISEIVTRVAAQLGLKAEDVVTAGNADMAKNATSAPPEATPHPVARAATLSPRRGLDHASFADIAKGSTSAPPIRKSTALSLTPSGARKVETALVELDACRAENRIENQQISNCQARAEADDATIQRQAGSIASLNRAIEVKDKILSRQAAEYQAELRAARGTFLGRLARTAERVAIGVAMGVAIGVAVK
jgi:hypothetical protein